MSTDSTELTFIRCPSCRSLVPAVSPRCRMCGAVLDAGKAEAGAAAGEKEASRKIPARVRQQTVQVSDHEVKEARKPLGGSAQPGNRSVSEVSKEKVAYKQESLDEDYGDELEAEESQESSGEIEMESAVSQVESSLADDNEITDFGDPLGAFIEEVAVEDSIIQSDNIEKDSNGAGNGYHEEAFNSAPVNGDSPVFAEAKPEPAVRPDTESYKAKPVEVKPPAVEVEPRTRVVIESGQRKPGVQRSGLSFGRGRPEKGERPAASESRIREKAPVVAAPAAEYVEPAKSRYAPPPPVKPVEEYLPEPVPENIPVEEAPFIPPAPQRASAISSGPKPAADSKGRLYGWLVSYSDPKGVAIELREGKFFVSRSSLKGSDLILDDESISTPHALFALNLSDGLRVQDLMSDRGVFIRRRAGEAYQRVLESTKLEHGDWVRFGDVEFLVAVIALPGAN